MWPLIIGMLMKYGASEQASDRQARLQKAMQSYQVGKAADNEKAINNLVQTQTPAAREQELQGIEASRSSTMQQAVDTARASAPSTQAANADSSADYRSASATAANTLDARTKRIIQALSVMGAPGEQSLKSGIRFGRAAGQVDAGNQAIANVGNAYMTSIKNTVPNPALTALGDAAMAYGMGSIAKGAGTAGGADPYFTPSGATDGSGADVFANSGETTGGPVYSGASTAPVRVASSPSMSSRLSSAFRMWGR